MELDSILRKAALEILGWEFAQCIVCLFNLRILTGQMVQNGWALQSLVIKWLLVSDHSLSPILLPLLQIFIYHSWDMVRECPKPKCVKCYSYMKGWASMYLPVFWCICVLSFFWIGKLAAVSGFPTYHLVDTQENGHYFQPSWPIRRQEKKDYCLELQGEMVFAFVLNFLKLIGPRWL